MNSKYGEIPNLVCFNYLSRLVDKLFKIIPLKETHSNTVTVYIEDLIYEITGNNSLFTDSNYNPKILDIICILESVKNTNMTHSEYRRAIFKCITIANQLNDYIKSEVSKDA